MLLVHTTTAAPSINHSFVKLWGLLQKRTPRFDTLHRCSSRRPGRWEKTQGRGKYASGSVFFGRVVVSFPAERAAGANRERSRAASPAPEVLIGAVLEVPAPAPSSAPAPAPSSAPAPAPPGPPAPPPPCFLSCCCAFFPQSGPRALKRCSGACLCCRGTCMRDTCLCCFRGALYV